jgi:hypothetical protein
MATAGSDLHRSVSMAHFFDARKATTSRTAPVPAEPAERQPRSALRAAAWDLATGNRWAAGTWLLLLTAAWIVKSQISAIVGEVTPTGQYPVTAVTGIGQLGSLVTPPRAALAAWDAAASVHFRALTSWLGWYLATDVLFIVAGTMLGVTLLKGKPRRFLGRRLLAAVAVAYAVEAVLAAIIIALSHQRMSGGGVPQSLVWPLHIVTVLKWLAVLALAGWLAVQVHASHQAYKHPEQATASTTGAGYLHLRRVGHALQIQRFSLVVVALLALIAIGPPVNGTLEQMPDVQRAWFNTGSFLGFPQLLFAAAAQLLLAWMLWSLGRMRVRRATAKFSDAADPRHLPAILPWVVVAVALGAAAAVADATGAARVSAGRVIACCAIPLLIAGLSLAIRWARYRRRAEHAEHADRATREPGEHGLPPSPATRRDPADEPAVRRLVGVTGDTLAVAVVGVTPLGIVRSFTAPALVMNGLTNALVVAFGLLAAAALPSCCWLVCCWRPRRAGRGVNEAAEASAPAELPPPPTGRESRIERALRNRALAATPRPMWAIGVVFALADAWLVFDPLPATHLLGVLATVVIAIGSLAVLLGVLAFLVQTRRPLELFRVLRLDVTPVLTILALIAVVGGLADRNSALHQVSAPVTKDVTARPPFAAVLQRWLASPLTTSCSVPAPEHATAAGHRIRIAPLIQVAASGGGIRAAWWTEEVLGLIARSPCGRHAVLDVSAVSGGAVGVSVLAAARGSAPVKAAHIAMTTMADPDALAAAIDGFVLRDTIAGYTGLDLWAAGRPSGTRYPDRAALMQAVWQVQDPALAQPFPLRHSWLPWALLFNSTSVGSGCRAVTSSVVLPRAAGFPHLVPLAPCGLGTGGMPGAYDLFARLPCEKGITTATAAMLSARYTYITPSGTLDYCAAGHKLADQLVDGGYGDASGLATLADLTPAVLAGLRRYNARAVATAGPGQPVTLVVPVTAYLGNSVQPARRLTAPTRVPEIEAPKSAQSAGPAVELTGTAALLQGISNQTGPAGWLSCAQVDPLCAGLRNVAPGLIPDPVVMITPTEHPGVAAPLGWLLSQASQDALDQALARDALPSNVCGPYQRSYLVGRPYCLPGVGGLADLLALIAHRG